MSNAVFPSLPGLTWNVVKKSNWSTVVQGAVSGMELRGSYFSSPLWHWTLTHEFLRTYNAYREFQTLAQFFNARQGNYDSFLYNDPSDNAVAQHGFGVGDGATVAFPLQRSLLGQQSDYLGLWPTISTPRTNYIIQSEALTAANGWTVGGITVTPAYTGVGALTLSRLVGNFSVDQVLRTLTVIGNGVKTVSMFVEYDGSPGAWEFGLFDSTIGAYQAEAFVTFDANGNPTPTIVKGTLVSFAQVANGLYRIAVCAPIIAANALLIVPIVGGSSVGSIRIGGVQVEDGVVATQYIATTTAAVTATPPYWPAQGYGFEPIYNFAPIPAGFAFAPNWWDAARAPYGYPRTNLCRWSEQFDNAGWGKNNGGAGSIPVVTPNQAIAPDGNFAADKIVFVAPGGADISLISSSAFTTVAASPYTESLYVKAFAAGDIGKTIVYRCAGGATYSLITLTAAWQRLSATEIAAGAAATFDIGLRPSQGGSSGTVTALFWGADVEAGTVATAYIGPTLGGSVTVAAEVLGSPTVFVNGVLQVPGTDYTLANGTVTFTGAPAANAVLTWTGGYSWRVRFAQALSEFNAFASGFWEQKSIEFLTVKGQ